MQCISERIENVRQRAQPSHTIDGSAELAWCKVGGCLTTPGPEGRLLTLSKPCEKPSARGLQNLLDIGRGDYVKAGQKDKDKTRKAKQQRQPEGPERPDKKQSLAVRVRKGRTKSKA